MKKIAVMSLSVIQSMAVLAASAAVDISPIVERIPNGVYVVTGVVSVAISDGPCSDFMLNVPCPESSQYQDISRYAVRVERSSRCHSARDIAFGTGTIMDEKGNR